MLLGLYGCLLRAVRTGAKKLRPCIRAVCTVVPDGPYVRVVCTGLKSHPTNSQLCMHASSHTRTVVRECFKGDEASQWKRPKFDPSPRQNPLTDLHQNWHAWVAYVLDGTRRAKFCSDRFKGFCSPNTRFCLASGVTNFFLRFFVSLGSSIRLQPTPVNGYLRKIRQMTSFRVRKCLSGVPMTIFSI